MTKENISATVDPEVAEFLDQPGRNRSDTINHAVRAYMHSNGGEKAMLELRKEQLKSRETTLESELQTVREELDHVTSQLQQHQQREKQEKAGLWEEAKESIEIAQMSTGELVIETPDSQLQYFVEGLDMEIDEFKAELKERVKDGR